MGDQQRVGEEVPRRDEDDRGGEAERPAHPEQKVCVEKNGNESDDDDDHPSLLTKLWGTVQKT